MRKLFCLADLNEICKWDYIYIIKMDLPKIGWEARTGLMWLRLGIQVTASSKCCNESSGFHKMGKIS